MNQLSNEARKHALDIYKKLLKREILELEIEGYEELADGLEKKYSRNVGKVLTKLYIKNIVIIVKELDYFQLFTMISPFFMILFFLLYYFGLFKS